MPTYLGYDELVMRYPLFAKWSDNPKPDVSSYMIYSAEQEIDGLLSPCFSVPFSDTPPLVKELTYELTFIKAMWGRDFKKAATLQKNFNKRIENIKNGDEAMVTASGTVIEVSGSQNTVYSTTEDYPMTHSMLDASDPHTRVSSQRLQDEVDDRD